MKMFLLLLSTLVMHWPPAFAATAGYVTESGTIVQDSTDTLLASGTSVTSSTATVTGAENAASVDGVYGIVNFGIKCDGATNDSAGLNSIGTFAAAQTSAGKTVTITFPSNAVCVHASSITTWDVPSLHVIGNGSRLKFTGSGKQIYLHSTASEVDNLQIEGLVLQGNANSTYGLYSDTTIARGRIQLINVQDQNTACVYAGGVGSWELMDQVELSCSSIKAKVMGTPQTTVPANGLILGDTGASFANNRTVKVTAEGITSGIGVWCKYCFEALILGTGEDSATGLQVEKLSSNNTFVGFDAESNTTQDVLEKGVTDIYLSTTSTGIFNFSGAFHPELIGGLFNTITDEGASVGINAHDLRYNEAGTGTVNVNGTGLGAQFVNVLNGTTPFINNFAPARFNYIFQSTSSTNTTARNWCWLPDATNIGFYELWMTTANTTDGCFKGAPVFQFLPGATAVKFPALSGGALELSGPHGTRTLAQMSDGSGASGDYARFAADGSLTDGGAAGVSCSGTPTSSFTVVKGIVTHC